MLRYVAPIYEQALVMMAIFQANGWAIDDLSAWTDDVRAQSLPQTATWSLKYWEEACGLPVNETLPIEVRRANVLAKRTLKTPMNRQKIIETAVKKMGRPASLEFNVAPYTFRITIESDGTGTVDFIALNEIVDRAKPAHLTVEYGLDYADTYQWETEAVNAGIVNFPYCNTFVCGTWPE
jgi:hypothetical protein